MATYKIPQDVEAEDKLLGPFTLKQFIFLIIVAISLWLTFTVAQNTITLIFIPLTITPALFFGLLVFLGLKNQSQPAENYLAAIVRFYFKTHKRIWSQDGYVETVHITVPKKEIHQYSNNFTSTEVRSRLNNLANLMDSRGWAAKDVRYQPNLVLPSQSSDQDDRLVSLSQLPQTIEPTDLHASDDVMDESNSPVAQHFDDMIKQNQNRYREQAVAHMNDPNYTPYPEMHQRRLEPIAPDANPKSQVPNTKPQPDSQLQQPETTSQSNPPIDRGQGVSTEQSQSQISSQLPVNPALVQLAQNDDLSVQTIASEAGRLKNLEQGTEIDLH